MVNKHVNISEQEGKDLIKKTFKMKKEPTTALLMGMNQKEGAAMWGIGNTDEVTTLLTTFAKQLPEDARYAICVQLIETIDYDVVVDELNKSLKGNNKKPKKLN